jgi:DNA-binding response OmpR family regulator
LTGEETSPMTNGKILIADDDRAVLDSLAIRLQATGYEVLCTQDGRQAMKAARAYRPDLMLLDINMPSGDGFSVHEDVCTTERLKSTPVVYLTGDRTENAWETAHSMGAFALIRKPFDTEMLLSVIAGALGQSPKVKDGVTPSYWTFSN